MANLVAPAQPKFIIALAAANGRGAGNYILGGGSNMLPSAWTVQIVGTNFTGTVIVKARSLSVNAVTDDAVPYQPTVYRKLWLNGAAGDGSLVATTITGTNGSADPASLLIIPATGLSISLETTISNGSLAVYAQPTSGPSVI